MVHAAEFVKSFTKLSDAPKEQLPEFAFIGRSNVGKSSLINYLLNRKKLAKVSQTPGKTQTINYFKVNKAWYLVDLPGYGYARISKAMRAKWEKMIKNYLTNSPNLVNVFQLIDARIDPQKIDIEHINWMGESRIPFSIVFTKADDPKKVKDNILNFKKALEAHWDELPPIFVSSTSKRTGAEEIHEYLSSILP